MDRAAQASGSFEGGNLRRPDAPVTARLPGHHVEMEVRRLLPAVDTVVLERQHLGGLDLYPRPAQVQTA